MFAALIPGLPADTALYRGTAIQLFGSREDPHADVFVQTRGRIRRVYLRIVPREVVKNRGRWVHHSILSYIHYEFNRPAKSVYSL